MESVINIIRGEYAWLWLKCLFCVAGIYTTTFVLTWLLPAYNAKGYAKDSHGKPLAYRLNGFRSVVGTLLVCYTVTHLVPSVGLEIMAQNYGKMSVVACLFGTLLTAELVYWIGEAKEGHVSAHDCSKLSGWDKFYLGVELNPRWAGVDLKMWFYMAGTTMIIVNVLSGVAYYHKEHQTVHPLLALYAFEMLWFCFDYLTFEHVHLTTYDLVAENVGYKLIWGCMFVFPFFYPIGLLPFIAAPPLTMQMSWWQVVASLCAFFSGWLLSRGANMQKYAFKTSPVKSPTFFSIQQETIAVSPTLHNGIIPARHIYYQNYLKY